MQHQVKLCMKPLFATSIADSQGDLINKLEKLLPLVLDRFEGIAVLATTNTDDRILKVLHDAQAFIDRAESDIDSIGLHRRQSVKLAMENSRNGHILYADADHILRWVEQDPRELDLVLARIKGSDCTVVGRGPKSFEALPKRLKETEKIVNHIFSLITGQRWDLMMAVRGLSRVAAELIVNESEVNTIGNDVDWPLLCKKNGLILDYIEAEGLTYKTEFDYANDLDDSQDQIPEAWALRVKLAYQHVVAMGPYIDK